MSKKQLNLKIITPSKTLVDEAVDSVYSTAVDGEFGVLPEHIPFMTALKIGVTKYNKGNETEYISTIGGIFQISDNNVVILTDAAEKGEEIDIPRARAAMERAEARLKTGKDIDAIRAHTALTRAMVRLQAASKGKHF